MNYKVNEIFHSISGEGGYAGYRCVFIRLTGCNLKCSYCDTTYAFEEGKEMTTEEIIKEIEQYKCRLICITGGEPLLQDINELLDNLLNLHYKIIIETNGSIDLDKIRKFASNKNVTINMDWKLPSSGMENYMLPYNLEKLYQYDELKFVIGNKKDYERMKELMSSCFNKSFQIYLSPVYNMIELEDLWKWIVEDKLDYKLQIQLHKVAFREKTRGV